MPFDLTSLTTEQCNRFVDRLATHLHHPDARARLMAVREAFAKAAGFPDAHAAERANPSEPFSKTLLWASQAWKKHSALLARNPFGRNEAEALIAEIWGYQSWRAVTVVLDIQSKRDEGLWIHGTEGELPALRLGQSEKGALGLSSKAWEKHVWVVDEDASRRRKIVFDWAKERYQSGDRVVVLDGSSQGPLSADHFGVPDPLVSTIDWRSGLPRIPRLANWSRIALTEFLVTAVLKRNAVPTVDRPFAAEETPPEILSWAAKKASEFKALPLSHQTTQSLHDLVATDESLAPERRNDWACVVGAPDSVLKDGLAPVEIVRLPEFSGPAFSAEQLGRIALASAWVKAELVTRFENQQAKPRLTVVWLDVPLWARAAGWSVVYAQARSLGVTFVEAGSRQCMWAQAKEKEVLVPEAASSLGNLNTKIFGKPVSPNDGKTIEIETMGKPRIVSLPARPAEELVGLSGSELVRFRPR